ncbi:hypothetical protein, conserved [Eimeria maxima]|uniref:Uncharacterized protein n=1 Tax=Eimeria maxima TaxID=5804 RepID=U6LX14_EIMMA|nr:hypothetical protein, conserved [Eimeria maxima]CDJ56271.1 hypothetical protein, conserved [Eimeria maxima]
MGRPSREYGRLASGLKAGGFTLPGEFAVFFRKKQQLPLQDDGVYRQQEQRPPRKIDAETTLVHNNFLYTGSPFKPQIGDIRVSFWANASSHISLIGKQTKPFFGSARAIAAAAAAELKEGHPLTIAAEGDYEPQRLIEHRLQDLGFPYSFVWTWRLVLFFSFFLLFVSFDGCGSEEAAAAEPTATTTQTNSKHFPLWTRVIVAALAAAAATFLLLAGACLLLPRLLPASTSPDTTAEGKYYDLGICLQVPGSLRSSTSSISHASSAAEGAAPEYKQGTVIRWTTTPALGPSPQDSLRRGSASAAAVPPTTGNSTTAAGSSEASSLYGAAYKNNGINSQDFGVYVPPPVMQTRAGSLTGVSLQKSSSKGSI